MTNENKKILIAGAGSGAWWNAGDEAIFSAMISDLRAQILGVQISVVSANPEGTLQGYKVKEIPIGDIRKLIVAAKESDLLILGGGGLFYDYWGFNVDNLLTNHHVGHGVYVDFALLATLLNKPLMIYAVGVGPLFSKTAQTFTKMVFEQAQEVTVRDVESKELLISIGIASDKVLVTSDPVFNTKEGLSSSEMVSIQEKMDTSLNSPVIGVSLRSWSMEGTDKNDWQIAVAQSLDQFIEQYGGKIFFIPFHKKVDEVDDSGESEKVRNLMKHADRAFLFEDNCTLDEKAGILYQCDLVLGMRLHSIIFAVKHGIPVVALAYDPKVSNLLTSLGQTDYLLEMQDLSSDHLFSVLQKAYENREGLSTYYHQQAEILAKLALKNAILAADLLAQNYTPSSPLSDQTLETIKSLALEQSLRVYEKEQEMRQKEQEMRQKEQEMWQKEQEMRQKEQETRQKEQETQRTIIELHQALTSVTQVLNEMQSSRSWRLIIILQSIRNRIAPPGSVLSRFLTIIFRTALYWYRKLKSMIRPREIAQSILPDFINRYISSPSETRVLLITKIFFDPTGNNMQFGGAERYLLELANMIRELGYEPIIIQCGNDYWMRYYGEQCVIGIQVGQDYDRFITELERLTPRGALAIYSPFELASKNIQMPAIGISHGIYWDDERYNDSPEKISATILQLTNKIDLINTLVSVDTNTINWLRTTSHSSAQKAVYIPNFVDLTQFNPLFTKIKTQRVNIVFPRRLVYQRGFWLVHQILPAILEKYPYVDFHFVGKGGPQEQQAITIMVQKYHDRVFWYFLSPEEMHEAYRKADIVLIPTTHSEGTSLSCLESLAMGNAVIATNVGGLPDLIIDEYNGLLIEPTAEALQKALERLIEDSSLRQVLGKRGQDIAKGFSIGKWREKWKDSLNEYLPARATIAANPTPQFVIFPYGWGINWNGVKQRPHHIAVQFSQHGFETYWYTPEGRQADPTPGIHLISQADELYINRPILFIYYPHSFPDIGRYKNPIVIYDVLDDVSIYEASGSNDKLAREGREYHQKLLKRADIVLASSRLLVDQVRQERPDVIYLPNGVDIEHFQSKQHKALPNFKKNGRPTIGYHGAVASWFDGNLIAKAAQLRPNYQFVIVGPVSDATVESQLRSQPNIQLLGTIPYEDIPAYVDLFDVGIMPFVLSKLTHAVRPLKILEYLSMSKPVVSTPIKEILDWPGVLFATDSQSFAEMLDIAIEKGLEDQDSVKTFVKDSTWNKVVLPLLKRLDK